MGRLPTTSPIGPRSMHTLKQAEQQIQVGLRRATYNADPDFSRKLTAAPVQFEVARP